MRMRLLRYVACVGLSMVLAAQVAGEPNRDDPPTAEEKKATVAYVSSLQRDSGGFAEAKKADVSATVPATFAAVYALKYFGGEVKDKDACHKFVKSCRNDEKRQFSPTPGGEPDLQSTALASMTLLDLKRNRSGSDLTTVRAAHDCFGIPEKAKTLNDFRLFGESYQTGNLYLSGTFYAKDNVIADLKKRANPDGSFGTGESVVGDTANAIIAIRSLGGAIDNAEAVAKLLKNEQRLDGGWGKDKSDLETTWRVVHALALLKAQLDTAACRKFIASCRNADGGYGPQPGQGSNVHATYYAGAALHRVGELAAREK